MPTPVDEGFREEGVAPRLGAISIGFGPAMKDFQSTLERLRREAAEAKLIADQATDKNQRELFVRLADHLNALADDVLHAIAAKVIEEDR